MNYKNICYFITVFVASLTSCKKNSPPAENGQNNNTSGTNVDVYVAGSTNDINGNNVATFWKNGKETILPSDGEKTYASVSSDNSDVYIIVEYANGQIKNILKNGNDDPNLNTELNNIKQQGGVVSGFTIMDNNVYFIGTTYVPNNINRIVTYWKNGEVTKLTDGSSDAFPIDISVNNNSICILGLVNKKSTYWKNGIAYTLSTDNNFLSKGNISLSGDDVYIAGETEYNGSEAGRATCWKNGKIIQTEPLNSFALGITTNGDDVYIAGYNNLPGMDNKFACYWKNGQQINLTNGSLFDYAEQVCVLGADVYVAGVNLIGKAYWVNGKVTQLDNSNEFSYVRGIIVISH